MSFLRMFGLIDKREWILKLETDIYILNRSVLGYLFNNIFCSKFNSGASIIWSQAVLDTLLSAQPSNEQAKTFYADNEEQIWLEALQLKKYPELSGLSGGVSYLYFAEICLATDIMNEPNVIQSLNDIMNKSLTQSRLDDDLSNRQARMGRHNMRYIDLRDRADQLGIFIPSAKDVCKSKSALNIINGIRSFTNIFLKYRID